MPHLSYKRFARGEKRDCVRITDVVTDGLTISWEVSVPADMHDKVVESLSNMVSFHMASHPYPFPIEKNGILGSLLDKFFEQTDIQPLSLMAWNPVEMDVYEVETYVPRPRKSLAGATHSEEQSNHSSLIDPMTDDPTPGIGI